VRGGNSATRNNRSRHARRRPRRHRRVAGIGGLLAHAHHFDALVFDQVAADVSRGELACPCMKQVAAFPNDTGMTMTSMAFVRLQSRRSGVLASEQIRIRAVTVGSKKTSWGRAVPRPAMRTRRVVRCSTQEPRQFRAGSAKSLRIFVGACGCISPQSPPGRFRSEAKAGHSVPWEALPGFNR